MSTRRTIQDFARIFAESFGGVWKLVHELGSHLFEARRRSKAEVVWQGLREARFSAAALDRCVDGQPVESHSDRQCLQCRVLFRAAYTLLVWDQYEATDGLIAGCWGKTQAEIVARLFPDMTQQLPSVKESLSLANLALEGVEAFAGDEMKLRPYVANLIPFLERARDPGTGAFGKLVPQFGRMVVRPDVRHTAQAVGILQRVAPLRFDVFEKAVRYLITGARVEGGWLSGKLLLFRMADTASILAETPQDLLDALREEDSRAVREITAAAAAVLQGELGRDPVWTQRPSPDTDYSRTRLFWSLHMLRSFPRFASVYPASARRVLEHASVIADGTGLPMFDDEQCRDLYTTAKYLLVLHRLRHVEGVEAEPLLAKDAPFCWQWMLSQSSRAEAWLPGFAEGWADILCLRGCHRLDNCRAPVSLNEMDALADAASMALASGGRVAVSDSELGFLADVITEKERRRQVLASGKLPAWA